MVTLGMCGEAEDERCDRGRPPATRHMGFRCLPHSSTPGRKDISVNPRCTPQGIIALSFTYWTQAPKPSEMSFWRLPKRSGDTSQIREAGEPAWKAQPTTRSPRPATLSFAAASMRG